MATFVLWKIQFQLYKRTTTESLLKVQSVGILKLARELQNMVYSSFA